LILSGEKTSTWRMLDEKELCEGDELEFFNKQTGELFAKAKVTSVVEKTFGSLTKEDFEGHEKYSDDEEMLSIYSSYYDREVTYDTKIKIVRFKLLK